MESRWDSQIRTRRTKMVGGKIRGQRSVLLETQNQRGRAAAFERTSRIFLGFPVAFYKVENCKNGENDFNYEIYSIANSKRNNESLFSLAHLMTVYNSQNERDYYQNNANQKKHLNP
jgi:hypothetical protein